MKRPTSGSNLTDAILATAVILWPSITLGMAYDADRGTIAEWVAALATLGALLAALYAGQQAAKIVDVEQRRDADRDAAGRRAQADQVAAWGIKGKDLRPQLLQRPGLQRPGRRRVRGQVRRRPSGRSTTNPPPPREAVAVNVPRIRSKYTDAIVELESEGRYGVYPRMSVSIEFHDAAGVQWRRDARGTLTELDPIPRDH